MLYPRFAPCRRFAFCSAVVPVPEIRYRSVPDFLKLPSDLYFGEVAGVAVNSKRHIFVFSRGNTTGPAYGASAAQLLEFDQDGKFLREIGHNLYAWSYAHTVKVDRDDNIWVTDKGSDMVIKFNPEGRVVMVFGRKQEASDDGTGPLKEVNPPLPPEDGMFRQVTDVAWDKSNNAYISDGYVNSRIAKVDKDGKWIKPGVNPAANRGSSIPRIALRSMNQGMFMWRIEGTGAFRCSTVRESSCAKSLSMFRLTPLRVRQSGTNRTIRIRRRSPGSPWAICITPAPNQVLYSSDAYPGRIYKLTLDGKILGVLGKSGKQPGEFGWIHEIACPSENELYVAEILNWRVQKLILEPTH